MSRTIIFIFGMTLLSWLPVLPNIFFAVAVCVIFCVAWIYFGRTTWLTYPFAMLCGLSLAIAVAAAQQRQQLDPNLIQANVDVVGVVSSIPIQHDQQLRFVFVIHSINQQKTYFRAQLSWYAHKQQLIPALHVGDIWRLSVRLKPAHGFANDSGFDYEKWLFAQHIRVTGSVNTSTLNQKIGQRHLGYLIDQFREAISSIVKSRTQQLQNQSLILALLVGMNNDISQDDWNIFRATGTNHLMAIAGLHVGIVTTFIYGVCLTLWRRSAHLVNNIAAQDAAALIAFFFAALYCTLAGFALPTLRALLMLAVFLVVRLQRLHVSSWSPLVIAMLLSLLIDPLIVLLPTFYLSFGTCALIFFGANQFTHHNSSQHTRMQWVISLGLMPIMLWYFQQLSLVSLIANAIAIPWTALLILPSALLGLITLPLPSVSTWLLQWSDLSLTCLMKLLDYLSRIPAAYWQHDVVMPINVFFGIVGVMLFLAPRSLKMRSLGFILCLPMFLWRTTAIPINQLQFTLLDVGQGLAAVVQTHSHVLVFDTGPKFSPNFNAGDAVLIPFLRHHHIDHVDTVVISHGDSDHIGGAAALLKKFPVTEVITSVPEKVLFKRVSRCLAGNSWSWDGIDFEFLFPTDQWLGLDNNSSCVLRITQGKQHLLLTGDIEALAEDYLVKHVSSEHLQADYLVAAHHGSKTSSTIDFVTAVHPKVVMFATGYFNRFHFPHSEVIARYQRIHAKMFNTATCGAMTIQLNGVRDSESCERWKRHFWRGDGLEGLGILAR